MKSDENQENLNLQQFKVIDLGVIQKHTCNFLLVISNNFGRVSYRFRDRRIAYVMSRAIKLRKVEIMLVSNRDRQITGYLITARFT